jgi:phosphoribosylglycinamide formyltransferase-1
MHPVDSEKTITVLISGRGSNMQAIHRACVDDRIHAQVTRVVSDNPDAGGLEYAQQHGIATTVVEADDHPDRQSFDNALAAAIDEDGPTLVALAGFMRVLSAEFTDRYQGRLLNIHPSLLPRHKGLHTHERALSSGDRWHGCSVHFVSATLDGGPLIARSVVPVIAGDSADVLAERVLSKEHRLYPAVIAACLRGEIVCQGNAVLRHGVPLRYPLNY